MQLNKKFIEELHQKLTFGNTRSILINALPGRHATRLGLADLDIIKDKLAATFIEGLTNNKKSSVTISLDFDKSDETIKQKLAKIGKRLDSIKYENDDIYKETGVSTFGFGYPLLYSKHPKDSSKAILAPLFIFRLEIQQSQKRNNEWLIHKREDAEIRLNESLVSFFESEGKIKLPQNPEESLEDGILTLEEINEYCNSLLHQLNSSSADLNIDTLESLPEKILIGESQFQTTRVLNSGVFGIYKNQKQNIIKDLENLLSNSELLEDDNNLFKSDWRALHSPMPTDPSQNGVLQSLHHHNNIIIQGPPGTGKSQTLTALITSALANNKKILIVCEKRTALDVLCEKLTDLLPEIKPAIAIIEDVVADRAIIVQNVRNRAATILHEIHNSDISSIHEIRRFEDGAQKISNQYSELKKDLWQTKRWKDLVGLKNKGTRTLSPDDSTIHVLRKSFDNKALQDNDLDEILELISTAEELHKAVFSYKTELDKTLNRVTLARFSNVFQFSSHITRLQSDLRVAKASIEKVLIELENGFRNQYAKAIDDHLRRIEQVIDIIKSRSVNEIENPSIKTRFLSIFSSFHKQTLTLSRQAKIELEAIRALDSSLPSTTFSFDKIDKVHSEVLNNKVTIVDKMTEESVKKQYFDSTSSSELVQLKNQVIEIGKEINLLLLQNEFKISFDSVHKTYDEILRSIDFFGELAKRKSQIESYFEWCKLYDNSQSSNQKIINDLIALDSSNWSDLLRLAWYEHILISNYENEKYPTHDRILGTLIDLQPTIQKNLLKTISSKIKQLQYDGMRMLKQKNLEVNQLYNLRGSKGSTRNSLRRIIQTDVKSFTCFFPVVMVNPDTCSTLLPLQRNLFDLVIFDEASQLRLEDTFTALLRGRQVVISGDSMQMPPSNYFSGERQSLDDDELDDETVDQMEMASKESLLEFGIDNGFTQTYLDMHYRSKHPALINFSNACFYHGRLIPMPEKKPSRAIQYLHVDGLYEESRNETEAKMIIKILREELSTENSVGIATFNIQQRNLILGLIREERLTDSAFDTKISSWENMHESIFVKNLENIQGDERDIILISTTFGIRRDRKFIMNFGPIGQKNGHRLLNVIITRSKQKMYVVTSIPEEKQGEWINRLSISKTVNGTTGLLAFLTYSKAVSSGNEELSKGILETITKQLAQTPTSLNERELKFTESPFEEEVYSLLKEAVGSERILLQHKCGGFRIDMVVLPLNPANPKKLAVECDGAAYHSSPIAWHNDIFRQQQLEQHNFVFHRIWSTNWWRNPTDELTSLLDAINRLG